ncbi:MAG: protein kinase [Gemmatimonadaceae bacterium]
MPPAPGTTLGRYRLLAPLGAGGMGEVWRAHDANLDREVAIKLLAANVLGDGSSRERFRREALVLASISHPGVANIYDFDAQDGVDFIVMELVSGGSLEARLETGPMPIAEVIRVGAAIADALHDAHERGFLHRDLKPGNVVLTRDGQPKILDFGLAMLLANAKGSEKITQTGMILGSLPYMSPEQLLGEADSASTDIYALGVMMFEMAAGRRPFVKERSEALMFEIFGNAPPALRSLRDDVPVALDQLVGDCLAKEASDRPASAAAVGAALRAIDTGSSRGLAAPPAVEKIRAIAVLPLRNVSRDPAQEYFADGMTEAIISDLARIRALRVISPTSVMRYKGTDKSLPEIARELNVEAVLEGSALLVGNRVRISVQLVSARAEETLWADRYDRELTDVLALQSEVAESVAREIAIQLTPAEVRQLAARAAVNPEAHLEVLKCRHSAFAGSKDAVDQALRHARRALELDPDYALAWSALADCQSLRALRGMAPPAEAGAEATAAAQRALVLDPSLADAHVSLGMIQAHSGDARGGLRELDRAVELNPGHAFGHNIRARVLFSFERHEEALTAANLSVQLDPLSMLIRTTAGDACYFAREYEKSVFHYRMAIELDPRFDGAHTDLARSLEALGRFDEARAAYDVGRKLAGGVAGPTFGLAHLEAAAGNAVEARRLLGELTMARASRVVSAWGIGAVHASLGDVEDAFAWLETAVTEKASGLILLRVHPRLDPIRGDPRYWPLVRRVGLADADHA